jgi:hypothetical protein
VDSIRQAQYKSGFVAGNEVNFMIPQGTKANTPTTLDVIVVLLASKAGFYWA